MDKVILVVSDTNVSELQIILNKYDLKNKIFSIQSDVFPNSIETFKEPYFFVMNNSLNAENVFLVQFELSELTSYYLKDIFKSI